MKTRPCDKPCDSLSQGDDGQVVVEGFLNISWGVRRPIRLKIQDEKQTLPFAPPASAADPTSPLSPIGNRRWAGVGLMSELLTERPAALCHLSSRAVNHMTSSVPLQRDDTMGRVRGPSPDRRDGGNSKGDHHRQSSPRFL